MTALNRGARIVVVGGGKMGEAILGGWIASEDGAAASIGAADVTVVNPGLERREYLAERYDVSCVADVCDVEGADVVVLAVKPQVMPDVLKDIHDLAAYGGAKAGPLFVSIAAGLTTEWFADRLPSGARFVRVMPNTPLLVGAGATTVCAPEDADASDVALVCELFDALGSAFVVDESLMDATGALSGSGPAYVAHMIEALRDAGRDAGIDEALAEKLAFDTVHGTCKLMFETRQTPEQTRVAVCSPGGTTLAALAAMDEAGFSSVFSRGITAAIARSKELASC